MDVTLFTWSAISHIIFLCHKLGAKTQTIDLEFAHTKEYSFITRYLNLNIITYMKTTQVSSHFEDSLFARVEEYEKRQN